MIKVDSKTSYKKAIRLLSVNGLSIEKIDAPKPVRVAGMKTPQNLDHLTMGQFTLLGHIGSGDTLVDPVCIVMGLDRERVLRLPFLQVVGLAHWVAEQMKEVAKMFDSIPSEITVEQRRAGVERLNFGSFGLVDSYARRMGIADHDYVLDCVPWLRVWQCMKNDALVVEYEKRLRKVYEDK